MRLQVGGHNLDLRIGHLCLSQLKNGDGALYANRSDWIAIKLPNSTISCFINQITKIALQNNLSLVECGK